MDSSKTYDALLISDVNPFPFPDPPEKPKFMVGGDEYLQWFDGWFRNSLPEKKVMSYVVGFPGAGKSHLLGYLRFLMNNEGTFPGVFAKYEAGRSAFESKDLWHRFFSDELARARFRSLLPLEEIERADMRKATKQTALNLLSGEQSVYDLHEELCRDSLEALSDLLTSKRLGICIAIDNIDEHLRFMEEKIDPSKVVNRLAGVLRDTAVRLKQIAILLGCTTDAYRKITLETAPDMTFLRRVESQEITLRELTEGQSIELVRRYLESWASNRGVSVPDHSDCRVEGTETFSIYPFTTKAIRYYHDMTRKYAGDITAACSHSIDLLRRNNKVTVLSRDELILALKDLYAKRKFVVVNPELLALGGYTLKEEKLGEILSRCYAKVRARYQLAIDEATVLRSIGEFATRLGIEVIDFEPVPNHLRPQEIVAPSERLKVWKSGKAAIAVKQVVSQPTQSGIPSESVGLSDYVDVSSLIDAGIATHGILVLSWVDRFPTSRDRSWVLGIERAYGEGVIQTFNMDDSVFRILAAIEEGGSEKDELLDYVEKFHARLRQFIESLVQKRRPQFSSKEFQDRIRRERGGALPVST